MPTVENHVFERVDQLGLFATHGDAIEQAFVTFHADNPQVYEQLVKYARAAKAAGRRHFGIGMLWERLRWYVNVETTDQSGLKLNNNYRSRYARLLMERERCSEACTGCPMDVCLAGLFEIRHLASEPD
jgi:hypothetical protein